MIDFNVAEVILKSLLIIIRNMQIGFFSFTSGCHEDVHAHASRARPHRKQGDPVVRLPVGDQEMFGRGEVHRLPAGQTEGRDSHQRPPRHAEAGRDLPEHGVRLSVRTRAQVETRPFQSRRLHL
ncbi:hypothetical protein TNIN_318331 [Trichonephila inaurata madagascariensis]|uniref:Uncharacterized protein n=1 Tax=Trichonephila inaurata madagascariensis TaxID=2747483 RepID=A0A8X6X4S3_9ARAC|nr:hypothetical protein TNIN_318331 [Trichonephila inaurata madagascariensis]